MSEKPMERNVTDFSSVCEPALEKLGRHFTSVVTKSFPNIFQFQRRSVADNARAHSRLVRHEAASKSDQFFDFRAHWTQGMVVDIGYFVLLCLLSGVLAWFDIEHGIIPNWLNLTIAGLGLSKALIIGGPSAGLEAVCEAAVIGAVFWLLRRLYFSLRKIQGLGLGDVKFLAAAGIWVGVAGLPVLLMIAALTALACAGVMQLAGRQLTSQTSISFGPFLAIGLLFASGLQQDWPCC
jgi:leader peptidase (prepilin peptidase)/N-methyltransferase